MDISKWFSPVRAGMAPSFSRRPMLLSGLVFGMMLSVGGCAGPESDYGGTGLTSVQAASTLNTGATVWNGEKWNGEKWNGEKWNGEKWNGLGWVGTGTGSVGIGWTGSGWSGAPWSGYGWNGQIWNGQAWNDVPGQNAPTFTTLHNWLNHTDDNHDGIPTEDKIKKCGPPGTYSASYLNDTEDLMGRIQSLAYWVDCACPATVQIPLNDTHGRYSTTLYGGLGLAPTWCGPDANAQVPESEIQIVSACLLARVNMAGKHFPLSLRSTEPSTAVSLNEAITHSIPVSFYWGNLWQSPHVDTDRTTRAAADMTQSGGSWWNMERFSCSHSNRGLVFEDQPMYGREFDSNSGQGRIEYLGKCGTGRKNLGLPGDYGVDPPPEAYTTNWGLPEDPNSAQAIGGLTTNSSPASTGGSTVESVSYRGRDWRVMEVYGPRVVGFESPVSNFPASGTIPAWAQLESGSLLAGQAADCPYFTSRCQGSGPTGRALFGMTSSQIISVNLTGNQQAPRPGDSSTPVGLAIRYSWAKKLGPGQCDQRGCDKTESYECDSGVIGPSGCIGGNTVPAKLKVEVNNIKPISNGWSQVQGSGSPYGKSVFVPTYFNGYPATAYIYPVYMQDAASSPGWVDFTSGVTRDTVRARFQGETANLADAPVLDAAYFFSGPPPADADCTGSHDCWLYAGPNESLSLSQNQTWPATSCLPTACFFYPYRTPYLPPGTYTFKLTNMTGDADLYVRANAEVSTSNWDCRPYLGAGANEVCTITLGGKGGYLSVMVKGYSSSSSATLIGSN